MLIYICCSGGATSGFFCSKIRDAAEKEHIYVEYLEAMIKNFNTLNKEYNLILAYGPVDFISKSNIREYDLGHIIDQVWIAPQVRHMKDAVSKLLQSYQTPVISLDMKLFGTMDGKKAFAEIQALLDNMETK